MEAFSDVVIGFSLAQIAVNLVPPDAKQGFHAADFFASSQFLAFILTFTLVSAMWWNHNRLFARYLVPNPVSIVLNFAMLGCLVLFVFSIQVFVHTPGPDSVIFYAAMFALTYVLLGILYIIGSVLRRTVLTHEEFRKGFIRGLRHATLAIGIIAGILIFTRVGLHVKSLGYLFFPPVVLMVAVGRLAPVFWPVLRKAT